MNWKDIGMDRIQLVKTVSRRLLIALFVLVVLLAIVILFTKESRVALLVVFTGQIGGFVSLQRRIKSFGGDDLRLLSESWVYTVLAPFTGGILALLIYVLFLSGLLAGDLFPVFKPDPGAHSVGFEAIFDQSGTAADYAKLIFWAFVAGFSEKFVVDVIGRFQSSAVPGQDGD